MISKSLPPAPHGARRAGTEGRLAPECAPGAKRRFPRASGPLVHSRIARPGGSVSPLPHLAPRARGRHVSGDLRPRPRMPRLPLLAAALAACGPPSTAAAPAPAPAPVTASSDLTRTIEAQFARSAEAWNRGDLEAFMADYARDSLTSFVAGGHVQRGYDWIHGHYAPWFAPGARRDSLRFEELAVRPLGPTLALVTARFILSRGGQTTASGPFTLVMERRAGGWKILHDHTSSDGQ